jgi:hypothetical protein
MLIRNDGPQSKQLQARHCELWLNSNPPPLPTPSLTNVFEQNDAVFRRVRHPVLQPVVGHGAVGEVQDANGILKLACKRLRKRRNSQTGRKQIQKLTY